MRLLLLLLLFSRPPGNDKVYVCTGPKAYAWHSLATCSGLKNCSAETVSLSQAEAEKMGRKACQLCVSGAVSPKPAAFVSDGQCSATTKKGTRCSRRARSGGYCWQHGG